MTNPLIINQIEEVHIINKIDIIYCQASEGYSEIFIKDGKRIMITKTLSKIAKQLDNSFIRVSQSFLINKLYIRKILKKEKLIILTCNREISFTIKISELMLGLGSEENIL